MNEIIKEMLQILSTLQLRVKEKDPMNAKKKERFVMGLKQVNQIISFFYFSHIDNSVLLQSLNSIKSGRSKLILLAPDTEECNTIDDKITLLINEANNNHIPILYTFNRRKLGKVINSSMKQSVVSLCNPEGAFELYKQLLKLLNFNNE